MPDPPPPEPRSALAAVHSLRRGDRASHLHNIGKGPGVLQRALALQQRLDPQAWLVAMGAVTRQHNLAAAAAAMHAGDEAALLAALGCGDQPLRLELLDANHSVTAVRAGGRNYYRFAEPAADALNDWEPPPLPPGALALHVTALAEVGERDCRLQFGCDENGMTDLRVAIDQAGRSKAPPSHDASAHEGALSAMGLSPSALQLDRYVEVTVRLLQADGSLYTTRLVRAGQDWALLEHNHSTIATRLAEQRDGRLTRIQLTAASLALRNGRWPAAPDLLLRPADWFDPASPRARNGWSEYENSPPRGLELAHAPEPDDVAVFALHRQPQGRRAITRKGELKWIP